MCMVDSHRAVNSSIAVGVIILIYIYIYVTIAYLVKQLSL
jgi:hypothetical protein